jgi:hypothetical protein
MKKSHTQKGMVTGMVRTSQDTNKKANMALIQMAGKQVKD